MNAPAIGSHWRGRDGRLFRVIHVEHGAKPTATLRVLNPKKRQRHYTEMALTNFSDEKWSAFLSPHEMEVA